MKLKHYARFPFAIRRAMACLKAGGAGERRWSGPLIGLDLYTDHLLFDCGRHLACLAAHAEKNGSQVMLRCDRMMLAAIAHKSLGQMFLSMENVSWVPPGDELCDPSVVLTDVDSGRASRASSEAPLVSMKIGRDCCPDSMVMPYPMHPNQIQSLGRDRLNELRSRRKAGVFFAGSQKSRYGRDRMREEFDVMPRLEVIETIRRQFPDRVETRVASGRRDRIVLRDSAQDPIDADDWMSVVGDHQFFLCCPGASQPICHHLVEAMSVGCIPILEYGDRLVPALADGVNAVTFSGPAGLVAAVERIDAMSHEEMQRLSGRVCEYYEQHLRGESALARILSTAASEPQSMLSMPFHDQNLFETDLMQSVELDSQQVRRTSSAA